MSERLPQRLRKYVHDAARQSSREVRAAYERGELSIQLLNHSPVAARSLDQLVYEQDRVRLRGHLQQLPEQHFYAILNKPPKTLSVPIDLRGKGDLSSWLSQMPEGTFAVGRLDRDTTGALLFTTDGDLANGLLRPERHADKLYYLQIAERLDPPDPRLQALLTGIDVGPYFAKAKQVEVRALGSKYTELVVTLDEGKHRQIRRMCRAVKLPLRQLHRHSVGTVAVAGMATGDWRALTPSEVLTLWTAAGGRQRLEREQHQTLCERASRHRAEGRADVRLEQWLAENP